jgi:hypothetical protein
VVAYGSPTAPRETGASGPEAAGDHAYAATLPDRVGDVPGLGDDRADRARPRVAGALVAQSRQFALLTG